jgi:hypothetical protein
MSQPCNTDLCDPSKCTDELCPTYLDAHSRVSSAELLAVKRGADKYVSEKRSFVSDYINNRHPHNKGVIV